VTEQVYTPSCPERVVKVAAGKLGPQLWNPQGQTRLQIEGLCAFAIEVWVKKYGGLTDKQIEYACEVFEWAIGDAVRSSRGGGQRYAHLYQNFHRVVNEDRVHEGMRRRAGAARSPVDTSGLMVAA
jgi:hypothetical protein